MSSSSHSSLILRWHHRVLGGVWALCGLLAAGSMVLHALVVHDSWAELGLWIGLFVATSFVVTAIGFTSGRKWARRTMGVLMVVATVLFLDLLLMSGWTGDRQGVWQMLVALGFAGYTLLFLAISAAFHSVDSPG